jgi:hypothetical protein
MARKSRFLFLAVTILFGWTPTSQAASDASREVKMRVCFGDERHYGCPVSTDAMFSCGNDHDKIFQQICSKVENGKQLHLRFTVIHQGSHPGGMCGYAWYELTCHEE